MNSPESPAVTRLGAFDVGCVVVGGIIGVGIFFTPAKVAAACDDPSQVIVAWLLGGAIAVLGALVFAELSQRVPSEGGMFAYVHEAWGPLPAFLYGWANWLVIQAGALAVIGMVMVDHADKLVHGEAAAGGTGLGASAKVGLAVGSIGVFTALNVLGLRVGKGVQNTLTVLKTAAVGALVVLGVFVAGRDPEGLVEAAGGENAGDGPRGWLAAMSASMLPVLFSFGGWQQGSFVSRVARSPRVVALGILGGVAVVVVAYLTVNLAFLSLLGFEGARTSTTIGADAAEVALDGVGLGEFGGRAFAALVVLSSLGIMNTICLAPPFVLHAMARRGLFFATAGHLHPRFGTPTLGVLCQGLWAIALLLLAHNLEVVDLDFLLNGVVFVDWLFFVLCGAGLWRLLRRDGTVREGFHLPGIGPVALLFTAAALAVMAGAIWQFREPTLAGLGVCAVGVPAWALMRWLRSR